MRLAGFIPREMILAAVTSYELVEAYPDDKYLPSYLILARHGSEAFHVLFATDLDGCWYGSAHRMTGTEYPLQRGTRRPGTLRWNGKHRPASGIESNPLRADRAWARRRRDGGVES